MMKVIDIISLGSEDLIYIITDGSPRGTWRGTRRDFIREMSAFFLLFYRTVVEIEIGASDVLILHI